MNFSVLMSVYVKEKPEYLKEALDSVYFQSLKPAEIVLVKDGPLNEKLDLLICEEKKRFIDAGIDFICVRLDKNMGLGAALQIGLTRCSHELIVRMDTDDIAAGDRFKVQIEYMKQNCDISVLGGYIDEFVNSREAVRVKKMPLKYNELFAYGKYRNPLNHMTVCFRKKDVLAVGGYMPLKGLEDYYLWSRMLAAGYQIENIGKVLVHARLGNFESRRGGIGYFFTYLKLRLIQKQTGYINIFEFIKAVFMTACITLAPKRMRGMLYKLLRNTDLGKY